MAVGFALLPLMCACSSTHPYATPNSTKPTAVVIRPTATHPATTLAPPSTSAPAATASTTSSTTATTTTTAPVAPVTEPVDPTSLAALILDSVPSGYIRQPDDIGDTGPTNITKAALDDVSTNARRALLVTGFVDGYQRQWTSGDTFTIDQLFLYEFETAKGAQGYAQHWRDTLLSSNEGVTLKTFTPAFLPGAFGLQGKDKTGSTGVVMLAKGNYAIEATVNSGALDGGKPVDSSGPATALAVAQADRLP